MTSEHQNQTALSGASSSPPKSDPHTRCAYKTADGRRCTTLRSKDHPSLCARHARQEFRNAQRAAARLVATSNPCPPMRNFAPELLGPIKDFHTAASINHALGRLLVLVAGNRIPPRSAAIVAYICQLLLQSLSEVKLERIHALDQDDSQEELFKVINSLPDLRPSLGSSKAGDHKP